MVAAFCALALPARAGASAPGQPGVAQAGPAPPAGAPPPSPGASVAKKRKGKPPMDGVLNVNRASVAELRLLDGVGKRRAELIVERRDRKPFGSLDELARMKGMKGIVRRHRSRLTVQGDTTLHPAKP
jgi:competence protein ComEA